MKTNNEIINDLELIVEDINYNHFYGGFVNIRQDGINIETVKKYADENNLELLQLDDNLIIVPYEQSLKAVKDYFAHIYYCEHLQFQNRFVRWFKQLLIKLL